MGASMWQAAQNQMSWPEKTEGELRSWVGSCLRDRGRVYGVRGPVAEDTSEQEEKKKTHR